MVGGELVFEFAKTGAALAAGELVFCPDEFAAPSTRAVHSSILFCVCVVRLGILETSRLVSSTSCGMTLARIPPSREMVTTKTMTMPQMRGILRRSSQFTGGS